MLNDIPAIHNSSSSLTNHSLRTLEDLEIVSFPAATNQNRYARNLHHVVIILGVIGWIGFDHAGPPFNCLAHQRQNLCNIAVDHIADGLLVGPEDEWFN